MRCRVLVHIVDGTSPDPVGDYEVEQKRRVILREASDWRFRQFS